MSLGVGATHQQGPLGSAQTRSKSQASNTPAPLGADMLKNDRYATAVNRELISFSVKPYQ